MCKLVCVRLDGVGVGENDRGFYTKKNMKLIKLGLIHTHSIQQVVKYDINKTGNTVIA